ncbi:3-hydroxyacyl-ACP dehydratase [Aequorivita echinoideorum]|uniref:3-hydroxyacyl-ACP dehydratase n=1 Tax=Aequorivita echinoideorum TaxID=1549647 RepID=A0ABS5S3F5_9FLAO|nr:3-hydroxyacyl-ACP dehydratase [Aequorivita echinoideorum]MBT0607741.1 3-hydroxyacyl-ACP dehydratase [Aequorivita echinoideorum]
MLFQDLYSISTQEKTENGISVHLNLNAEHLIFSGHFPGNPVMPGVCMLQILKELTEVAVGKKLRLSTSTNVKFLALINPEKNPKLLVNIEILEESKLIKIKNITTFDDTVALKLNATFTIIS